MNSKIRIGTRGSELALKQAEEVGKRISSCYPNLEISIKVIKTTGDRLMDDPLAPHGGKGLFIKELEDALAKEEIDCAVHSMKDVPVRLPRGFQIAAITERADPRDALVSLKHGSLADMPVGASVGTSSPRRISQVKALRLDLKCENLRGNIGTRFRKLEDGLFDAIIVAAAALNRLGVSERAAELFDVDKMVPAAGQGVLAVEVREKNIELGAMLKTACHNHLSAVAVTAERTFLETVGGDCFTPIAAYAEVKGEQLFLTGWLGSPDGSRVMKEIFAGSPKKPEDVGKKLGELFLRRGAREILFKNL